jgi:hypothetical protein
MNVCYFGSALDEMKRRDQGNTVKVLRVLSGIKRFSVFDATANDVIARTMTHIHHDWELIRETGGEFPWIEFELTEAGRAALDDPNWQPPKPAPYICRECGKVPGRHAVVHGDHEKPTAQYTCAGCALKAMEKRA